jgi:hypothetical protein
MTVTMNADGSAECAGIPVVASVVTTIRETARRVSDSTGTDADRLTAEFIAMYASGARAMLDAMADA